MSAPIAKGSTDVEIRQSSTADLIDLSSLLATIWIGKWLLLIAVALGLALGVRELRNFRPAYEAHLVVMQTQPQQLGGGGGTSVGLQSLGISVGARQANNFDRFKLIFESIEFAKLMTEKHDLLKTVYGESWDTQLGAWMRPGGAKFLKDEALRRELKVNTWREPSLHALSQYLKGTIKFRTVGEGQFHRVSVVHADRDFALWLLTKGYSEAENMIREQDATENLRRRQYLEEQLARATAVEVRQSLAQLITSEERQAMMMQGSLPYVARIVIAASVGETKTEPEFVTIVGASTLVLLGLAALAMLLWTIVAKEIVRKKRNGLD